MRVDVVDLLRRHACVGHGHRHRARRIDAGRVRLGDVARVRRGAVAADLRVDLRAARLCVLELLEHEHRTDLAHHEAVASRVERARRALRVVVAPRERTHRAEPRDPDLVDRGLGAAAEHDVGAAEPDRVRPVADRHVRRRAGGALRRERALGAELHRDPAGAHVRDDRRDRKRVDPVGTRGSRRTSWQSWNEVRPPMPVAIAAPIRSASGATSSPAVLLGLARGRDDQLREAVHAARLLEVDPDGRVEVLHLARERDGVLGGVELGDRPRAGLAPEQSVPARAHVVAERR